MASRSRFHTRAALPRPCSAAQQTARLGVLAGLRASRVAMAAELPPTAQGLQRPPPVNRSSKWSLFGSSLVILAFSLRLLGDKWEHQARPSSGPQRASAHAWHGTAVARC